MSANPNEADYYKAGEPFRAILAKVDETESDLFKAGEPFRFLVIASLTQALTPSSITSTATIGQPRMMFTTQTISPSSITGGGTTTAAAPDDILLSDGRIAIRQDDGFYIV